MSAEKLFMETTLEMLTLDSLYLILEKLSPQDILNLCLSSERFEREYCDNDNLWKRLIDRFYPDSFYTDNPRAQFEALVNHETTEYFILDGKFDFDTAYLHIVDEEALMAAEEEGRFFRLEGLPPRDGAKVWVLHYNFEFSGNYNGETQEEFNVHKTRENAVDDFFSNFFDAFTSELSDYVDQEMQEEINIANINLAAEELGLPTPVTEKRWREWFENNNLVTMSYRDGDIVLRTELVEVTLRDSSE